MGKIKFLLALIITVYLLCACGTDKKTTNTTSKNSTTKSEIKNGKVGKYTFSYSEGGEKIAVIFDGKGIEFANENVIFEDIMILSIFASTINSISGFEDIKISSLSNQAANMDTSGDFIRLKGKNCTYNIKFVVDVKYISGFVFNKCNE
jgi:hypothetical protein